MSEAYPPDFAIRGVTPADHAAWLPLWRGYQTFYKVELSTDVDRTTWSRLNDPAEPVRASLAWRGEAAIGLVQWVLHRSTWTIGDYCYLQDLFVAAGLRGGGIGRRLIEHVYAEAAQAGCARVYWLTHQTNNQAIQLYDQVAEKSGFVQYRKALP